MKYIFLLLITVLIASCGTNKIRFVRNHSSPQKVVEITQIPSLKKSMETLKGEIFTNEVVEKTIPQNSETATTDELVHDNKGLLHSEMEAPTPRSVQDSTVVSPEEADAITQEALRAEQLGSWSLALSIMTYLFVLLAGLALVFAFSSSSSSAFGIAGIALLIMALGSIITGLIVGIISLRASYNTPPGRRRAIAGVIISSIGILLVLVNVAFSF